MGGKKRFIKKENSRVTHPKTVSKENKTVQVENIPKIEPKEEHSQGLYQTGLEEEAILPKKRHIVKRILRIHHDFPPGISVLLTFSALMGILYIIIASMFSFTMTLGVVIQGAASRLLNIFIILIIAFMIFGISKKKIWAYYLALIVFSMTILNSVVSMFFIKKSVSGILTVFVTLSFFFMLMMNLITLWFVRTKKTYFLHHYHPTHMTKEDRAYIYGLTALWIAFIFTAGVLGSAYYNETIVKTDRIITELKAVYPYEVQDYCSQKVEDRDLCFLTGAIMYEKIANPNLLCKNINSEFYRYTCFKAIQGDVV